MRFAFLIAAALVALTTGAARAEDIPAVVAYWHDPDTVIVNIPGIPFKVLSYHLRIRLDGVDGPEIDDPNPIIRAWSVAGRDYASQLAPPGTEVLLKNVKKDDYFRLDATIPVAISDVAAELQKRNYVRPFDARHARVPWTPADCHPPKQVHRAPVVIRRPGLFHRRTP